MIPSATRAWLNVHVMIPLLPYFVATIIRSLANYQVNWITTNPAELALSLGLIAVFMRHSILGNDAIIESDEAREKKYSGAALCTVAAVIYFGLFVFLELVKILVYELALELEKQLYLAYLIIILALLPFVAFSIGMQKTHRLKVLRP